MDDLLARCFKRARVKNKSYLPLRKKKMKYDSRGISALICVRIRVLEGEGAGNEINGKKEKKK